MGRVLQRRALLVSPALPLETALRRAGKPLRLVAGGRGGAAQICQLGPHRPRIGLVDRAAPIGPQVDAVLAADTCLPTTDPRKSGLAKAMFPWDY